MHVLIHVRHLAGWQSVGGCFDVTDVLVPVVWMPHTALCVHVCILCYSSHRLVYTYIHIYIYIRTVNMICAFSCAYGLIIAALHTVTCCYCCLHYMTSGAVFVFQLW